MSRRRRAKKKRPAAAPRPPRVMCIDGVCNYDHLRRFLHYVSAGFVEQGAVVSRLDLARGEPGPAEQAAVRAFAPDFAFSFNLEGAALTAALGVPLTSWMVDEPYFHPGWAPLLRAPHVSTVWAAEATARHARAMGARDVSALPLGGRAMPPRRDEDRSIGVLFAGSVADPERMRASWTERLGPSLGKLVGALVEDWGADPNGRELLDCLHGHLDALGLRGHPGVVAAEPLLLGEANRYVRTRDRVAVVQALAHRPELTVIGDGWPALLEGARCAFRPAVPYGLFEEAVNDAQQSLIVQPVHAFGPSERHFLSMANQSAVVTTQNDWLDAELEPAVTHQSFDARDPDGARETVEALLDAPTERRAMIEAARERVLAEHTWSHRAAALLDRALGRRHRRAS